MSSQSEGKIQGGVNVCIWEIHKQEIPRQCTSIVIKIYKRCYGIKCYSYGWRDTGAKISEGFHYKKIFNQFLLPVRALGWKLPEASLWETMFFILIQNSQKYDFSKSKYSPNISSLFLKYFPNMILTDKHWDNFWHKARFWRSSEPSKKICFDWCKVYFHYFWVCKTYDIIFLLATNFDELKILTVPDKSQRKMTNFSCYYRENKAY